MAGISHATDDPGVTTGTAERQGWTRAERAVLVAIVVVLSAIIALPQPWFPTGQPVGWTGARDSNGGGLGLLTTSLEVGVYTPPEFDPAYGEPDDGAYSWLGTPTIIYTPWQVVVTLHTGPSFDTTEQHGFGFDPIYVPVHLAQPLLGRLLVDGSGGAIPGPIP